MRAQVSSAAATLADAALYQLLLGTLGYKVAAFAGALVGPRRASP